MGSAGPARGRAYRSTAYTRIGVPLSQVGAREGAVMSAQVRRDPDGTPEEAATEGDRPREVPPLEVGLAGMRVGEAAEKVGPWGVAGDGVPPPARHLPPAPPVRASHTAAPPPPPRR